MPVVVREIRCSSRFSNLRKSPSREGRTGRDPGAKAQGFDAFAESSGEAEREALVRFLVVVFEILLCEDEDWNGLSPLVNLETDEDGHSAIDKLSPRELPGAARNFAVAAGIGAQRASELRGDPSVVEHRSTAKTPEEYERALKRLGIEVVRVEAEDVEIVTADPGEGQAV